MIYRTKITKDGIQREAELDISRTWRYSLSRTWDVNKRIVVWIMLNPSTADALIDDPTIRRCMGFSRQWGFGGIHVVNLFALRATDPARIVESAMETAVGPLNDVTIQTAITRPDVGLVVCAWGALGMLHGGRDQVVLRLVRELATTRVVCLGITAKGQPRHPLYLAATTSLLDL